MNFYIIIAVVSVCSVICRGQGQTTNSSEKVMPLSYFKKSGLFGAMKDKNKFIDMFIANYEIGGTDEEIKMTSSDKVTVVGTMPVTDFERSDLATTISHAGCDPYDQVVEIPNDKSNVLLYPSCVSIKQCGGCCGHPSLACKPTTTQDKIVQVLKYIYDGSQAHPVEKVDYVQLKEHTGCECQCKISESDCTPELHTFDDWDCKCVCKKAKKDCGFNKRWDESLCDCRCASVQNCGTGYKYNMLKCACEEDSERSAGDSNTNIVDVQPDQAAEKTVDVDPCNHLSCPKWYKSHIKSGGKCVCKFDREKYLNRNA